MLDEKKLKEAENKVNQFISEGIIKTKAGSCTNTQHQLRKTFLN